MVSLQSGAYISELVAVEVEVGQLLEAAQIPGQLGELVVA
jgi:hypothetical protein